MIELQMRVILESGPGPLIYDNLVFTPKAYWKIDQFRAATGEKLIPGQKVVFNAEDCLDRKGRAVFKVENYQGRDRNKVDYYVVGGTKNELGEPVDLSF